MRDSKTVEASAPLKRALRLATEALDLLDAYCGPPDAAAHLELALKSLRAAITK